MKKNHPPKRALKLTAETLRKLSDDELPLVAGGESNTYCAGCGTGGACPQLKF